MLLLSLLTFWTNVITEIASTSFIAYPRLESVGPQKRDVSGPETVRTIHLDFGSEFLISNLTINTKFFVGHLKSNTVAQNGSLRESNGEVEDGCYYYLGRNAAIQECPGNQITGILGVGRRLFTLEPLSAGEKSNGAHNITEIRGRREATGAPLGNEGNLYNVGQNSIQWENHSKRVSSFLFLSHGGNGAAITKKLEQKGRRLVLRDEEISFSRPGY